MHLIVHLLARQPGFGLLHFIGRALEVNYSRSKAKWLKPLTFSRRRHTGLKPGAMRGDMRHPCLACRDDPHLTTFWQWNERGRIKLSAVFTNPGIPNIRMP